MMTELERSKLRSKLAKAVGKQVTIEYANGEQLVNAVLSAFEFQNGTLILAVTLPEFEGFVNWAYVKNIYVKEESP